MKAVEIKKLTDVELVEQLAEFNKELLNLRLQAKTGQIENTSRIRVVRKSVARIKTEQTARIN